MGRCLKIIACSVYHRDVGTVYIIFMDEDNFSASAGSNPASESQAL